MAFGPSLEIKYGNLKNPEGMIEKANANVRRIRPKVSGDLGSSSAGVIESGEVTIDLGSPDEMVKLRKKKPKNTHKAKRKKSRK